LIMSRIVRFSTGRIRRPPVDDLDYDFDLVSWRFGERDKLGRLRRERHGIRWPGPGHPLCPALPA
jgi:hypothetical protein